MYEIRYCPLCGASTAAQTIHGHERVVCPACGFINYVNPIVAAGTLVEEQGRVLLIRRGVEPGRGQWGLPAGYAEVGESPEQTALRETREETGLEVELGGLLGAFGFGARAERSGVVILFKARPIGGALVSGDDAIDVRFFSPSELPPDIAFHIHRQLLERWAKAHALTYRVAQDQDAPAIATIARVMSQIMPSLEGCSEGATHIMATDSETLVGLATLQGTGSHLALSGLFVLPNYRSRGIASRLLAEARAWACAQKAQALQAELPTAWPEAISLLLRHGFQITGYRPGLSQDLVEMALPVCDQPYQA